MIYRTIKTTSSYALPIKHSAKSFSYKKIITHIIILFLLIATTLKLEAQNALEKDFSYYYDKAITFSHNNNDSLIYYAKKMQLSKKKCKKTMGTLYEARGFYQKGNHIAAEQLALLALEQIKNNTKICDKKNLVDAYRRLFYISKNKDNYDKALEYLLKRKEVIETLPTNEQYYNKNIVDVEKCIASLKVRMGAYDDALKTFKACYEKINTIQLINQTEQISHNFSLQKANILNAIGDTFLQINDNEDGEKPSLDSANYYYKKAFNITKSLPNPNIDTEPLYQMRNINIFIRRKDYKSALFYLNRFDSIYKKSHHYTPNIYYYKSTSHRHLNHFDSAIYFSKKYINYYETSKSYGRSVIPIYDNLAYSYAAKKMNDSALVYSNLTLSKVKEIEKKKQNVSIKIYNAELENFKKLNESLQKKNKQSGLYKYITICLLLITPLLFIIKKLRKKNTPIKTQDNNTLSSTPKSPKRNIDLKISEDILERIAQFEKTNLFLNSDFNINRLAKHLKTNTTYLSTVINNHKKQTFKQYLSELRIKYAINKISTDIKFANYSIEAIAMEVGYTNASAFTRVFKKHMGKTPSEYIKSIKHPIT